MLADVEASEPADKAGLEVGDIVLSLDGKTMRDVRQFELNLYRYRAGQQVSPELLRGDSLLLDDVIYSVNTSPVTSAQALRAPWHALQDRPL